MLHTAIQLLLYGILADFSPLALAATIAVMQAGRLRALGFGTGFVAGQLLTCSLFVIVGVVATGSTSTRHAEVQAAVELVLAVALVALAARVRARPPAVREGSSERTQTLLERLGRLHLVTTVLAGLLLGIGGPKRLVLTALAATAITTAGVRDSGQATLVIWYVALATAVVWAAVAAFVVFGERAVSSMTAAQEQLARRRREVTTYALLLIAAGLVLDAITVL